MYAYTCICASIIIYQTIHSFRFNTQNPKKVDFAMPSSDMMKKEQGNRRISQRAEPRAMNND